MPEFCEWLSTQRRRAFEDRIDDVKQRAVELALHGSAEHIRIVLELAGLLGRGRFENAAQAQGQTIVQINVPRPHAPPGPLLDVMPRPMLPPPISDSEH
jgi:hypothetical protein